MGLSSLYIHISEPSSLFEAHQKAKMQGDPTASVLDSICRHLLGEMTLATLHYFSEDKRGQLQRSEEKAMGENTLRRSETPKNMEA